MGAVQGANRGKGREGYFCLSCIGLSYGECQADSHPRVSEIKQDLVFMLCLKLMAKTVLGDLTSSVTPRHQWTGIIPYPWKWEFRLTKVRYMILITGKTNGGSKISFTHSTRFYGTLLCCEYCGKHGR